MRRAGVIGLVLALAAATACTAGGSSKAGGGPTPVTLRIGTDDEPGRPAAEVVTDFARRVEALSDGQLLVEPVWKAAGHDVDDWDQRVARLVVDGDLDLALVPARAWDTEGVTSLRALQAPYVLTSPEAVAAVVTSDLAPQLMAGLDQVGVTGLALVPEELRYLVGFGEPVLHPGDLWGGVVRAPTSATTAAVFTALRARVEDLPGRELASRVDDGTVVAAESSFAYTDSLAGQLVLTGDLVLFPKVQVLVAGDDALAGLSASHRAVLRRAAAGARDHAVRTAASPGQDAARFCARGGTVVLAGEVGVTAFRRAADPVLADLARDPVTGRLLGRLRAVAARAPAPPPVPACAPPAVEVASPSDGPSEFPEGTYRTQMSREALLAGGLDPGSAADFDGTNDLRFRDGRWFHDTHGAVPGEDCGGAYDVEAGRLVVRIAGCPGAVDGVLFSAAWTLDGDRLTFRELRSETDPQGFVDTLWGRWVWERIE